MAATKNLSEEDENTIIELYKQGLNQKEIGKKFGISGTSVRYKLKQAGVYDRQRGKWTEEEKQEMIKMYHTSDILVRDIAKHFDISEHYCAELLKRWGVKRLGAQRALIANRNNVKEIDIVNTYNELRDIEAVARVYKTSDTSIRTILKKNGLTKVGIKYDLWKFIESKKEYIYQRVAEGSGIITICRELGDLNPTTLYNHTRKWGLKTEYPLIEKVRKILSENREQMFKDYYELKLSLGELATKYGISPSRMGIEVAKWGWKIRWSAVDSSIERFTEKCLTEAGVSFVKQFKLGRSKCDFFLPDANLIIEANGDYWHSNPLIYKESEFDDIQRKNMVRDAKKYAAAKKAGHSIVYVWESEIKKRPEEVKAALMALVANPTSHSSCRDFLLAAKDSS